jgi:hypothetical protein
VLLAAHGRVLVEHVVEVGQIGEPHAGGLHRRPHAIGPRAIEGAPQVEGVGHRIEHRLGRDVRLRGVQRGRELDVRAIEIAREGQPFLHGAIGIGVAHGARGELLERGGEHAQLHEPGLEGGHDRARRLWRRPYAA